MAIGLHMGISKSCLTLACGGKEGSGAFLRALHLTGKKQTVQILSTKQRDCLHSCWSQEAPWLSDITRSMAEGRQAGEGARGRYVRYQRLAGWPLLRPRC